MNWKLSWGKKKAPADAAAGGMRSCPECKCEVRCDCGRCVAGIGPGAGDVLFCVGCAAGLYFTGTEWRKATEGETVRWLRRATPMQRLRLAMLKSAQAGAELVEVGACPCGHVIQSKVMSQGGTFGRAQDARKPADGDVTVCGECGRPLVQARGAWRTSTVADLAKLPDAERDGIIATCSVVLASRVRDGLPLPKDLPFSFEPVRVVHSSDGRRLGTVGMN